MLLWRHLADQVYQNLKDPDRLWHGLRVFAVDGTILTLPEALWLRFGAHGGCRGIGPTQSQAVFAYDVLARVPIKVRTGHVHADGRDLLKCLFVSIVKKGTMVLLDSGFYAFEIFHQILTRKSQFVIPMRSNGKPKLVERFSKNDGLYQIRNNKHKKALLALPCVLIVRIITLYRPGFRPRRIVTSLLDPVTFPPEEIALLYHERWHIETFFREFKHTLNAQHWHAQSLHAFYTELIFLMILVCLTRLAMADSGVCPSKLSFSKSLAWVKRMLALSAYVPCDQWTRCYQDLLQQLQLATIDIRPNRSFERDPQKRRQLRRKRIAQSLKEFQHAA